MAKGGNILFPYRAAFLVMQAIESLNRYEFQYGPYLMGVTRQPQGEVDRAIQRIQQLRARYQCAVPDIV